MLAVDFCSQPSLQMENLTELQRNRVIDHYGDMRVTVSTLMLEKWRVLGNLYVHYCITSLIILITIIKCHSFTLTSEKIFTTLVWNYQQSFYLQYFH